MELVIINKLTWSQLSSKRKTWLLFSYLSTPTVFIWILFSHQIVVNGQVDPIFKIILPLHFFSSFIIGGVYNYYYRTKD